MYMEVDIPSALSRSSLKLDLCYQSQYGINQWDNEKHWDFLELGRKGDYNKLQLGTGK